MKLRGICLELLSEIQSHCTLQSVPLVGEKEISVAISAIAMALWQMQKLLRGPTRVCICLHNSYLSARPAYPAAGRISSASNDLLVSGGEALSRPAR